MTTIKSIALPLIWVGSLGVCFEVEGGRVKLLPTCLKPVKIILVILETWNLLRKNKHILSFRKYTF